MHVLPLPFGLVLALLPRREIERIRRRDFMRPHIRNAARTRERFVDDLRYFRV
jgi:hypothetical protein